MVFGSAVCTSLVHCVAVCCSVLQCVAVCCSALQCIFASIGMFGPWRVALRCVCACACACVCAHVPSTNPSPRLAPGWGTAREVFRVKSASARPHHVGLGSHYFPALSEGGFRVSESANYALLRRLRSTEVGSKMWSTRSDDYAWHRNDFGSRYKAGLLQSRAPFAKHGEDSCKRGHCAVHQRKLDTSHRITCRCLPNFTGLLRELNPGPLAA